jgi:hypothetical protein
MKNPTVVIAATATVSAIMSTVKRPARRPRVQLRVARRQDFNGMDSGLWMTV